MSTAELRRIADAAGVPYLALDPDAPGGLGVDADAVAELDAAAARAFGVLPVRAEGDTLIVAVPDPGDRGTLASVQALTDLEVRPAVAAPERIRSAQDSVYGHAVAARPRQPLPPGTPPPGPATPEEQRRARQIARDAQLPFVSLEPMPDPQGNWVDPINHDAARRLGEEVCHAFKLIPIAAAGEGVALATADPSDRAALRVAALLAGLRAWVVVAPEREIDRAIHRVFRGAVEPAPLPVPAPAPAPPRAAPQAPPAPAAPQEPRVAPAPQPPITSPRIEEPPAPAPPAPAPSKPEPEPQPAGPQRLGEILLSKGKVSPQALQEALELQQRHGDRLGEILMHTGIVHEADVSAALAEQQRLTFTDPAAVEPDTEALALIPEPVAQRYRVVPLAMVDGVLYLAMADVLDEEAMSVVAEHVDCPVRAFVAPPTSVELLLHRIYASEYAEHAAASLLRRRPEESAHRVLSGAQRIFFGGLLIIGLICLAIWPIQTIVAFNVVTIIFYLSFSFYRFRLIYRSFSHDVDLPVTQKELDELDERILPIYTILVPLYKEAAVLPHLVRAIAAIDYPPARLDVKLLLEEDDEETLAAIRALQLPPHFKVLVVPDVGPKTKPKACNYGLTQARGEYVVIYDAEDEPEPDQLKKIVVAFSKTDDKVACIQCKLNYYNQNQNLLTRWFTCEYSMWFDLLLPGLDSSGDPIPLGGTSNHFSTLRLIELGAWDPFNVTEDADLGIRLHRSGYKTAIVDSTTYEEANSYILNWVRQRSRWVKGYIQTWLVQMRHPIQMIRQIGFRRFFSFQMTVGGTPAIFLLNPIYWALTTAWLLTEAGVIKAAFPGLVYYAAGIGLYVGNFLFAYMTAAGASRRGYHDLVKYTLLAPIYWVLMSWGAWKGFIQLFTKPFYWEKTVHGLHLDEREEAEAVPASEWIAHRPQ